MKIAHFTDSFLPKVDGVSVSVEELSKRQSELDEVRIYAPSYGTGFRTSKRGRVTIKRFPSIAVPTYKDAHIAFPNMIKLYKEVKSWRPDIIHVHTPMVMGMAGMLNARRLKIPVVGTYHTLVSEVLMYLVPKWGWGEEIKEKVKGIWSDLVGDGEGNGLVGGFVDELKSIMENGKTGEKKEGLPKRITWFLVNKFFNFCDVVITPSEIIRKELLGRRMTREVVAVSNGIDMSLFKAKKAYKKDYQVLHVGRMGYEKKIEDVVEVFGLVVKKIPQAKLTLVGDGPAKDGLIKKVTKAGLNGRVNFAGWVDRKKLGKIYRNCNVFVTASPMETQGLVILEAMAAGVPVVGVNKFAVGDIVADDVNGYLVEAGKVKIMADKVKRILTDIKLEERLGRAARETAMNHNINKTVTKIKEVYHRAEEVKRLANGFEIRAGTAEKA